MSDDKMPPIFYELFSGLPRQGPGDAQSTQKALALAPGGHVAVTETCWMKPNPPRECVEFWAQAYPSIRHVPTMLKAIDACGYDTVGHFSLPASSWWNDYYRPLQENISRFRERHKGEPEALGLADEIQREIGMWSLYSDFYSYEFFVMRAR